VVTRRDRIQALVTLRRVGAGPRQAQSKALANVDLALRAHPNEPDLLLLKGHLLERLGEYQEARRLYARVMRENGANVLAAMDMGHSYYYAGRLSLALRWYDHALDLLQAGHCWAVWRAEWEEAHWFRAWALAELGRTKAAVLCCRHGLAKAPRSHSLRELLTRFQGGDADVPRSRRR
jgi:tetratricopeptide (TPR) repeat protein